jgi:tetratricopeptide (TPR) repeat protein
MDHAKKGDTALSASQYAEAIQHYTSALGVNPTAVKYYIGRSTAYQRAKEYPEALADAEIAVVLAHKRATRELIKDAQFRRALALFFLERYGDAEFVLNIVKELDSKEKMLPIWTMKIAAKLEGLPEDDEKRKVTAKKAAARTKTRRRMQQQHPSLSYLRQLTRSSMTGTRATTASPSTSSPKARPKTRPSSSLTRIR